MQNYISWLNFLRFGHMMKSDSQNSIYFFKKKTERGYVRIFIKARVKKESPCYVNFVDWVCQFVLVENKLSINAKPELTVFLRTQPFWLSDPGILDCERYRIIFAIFSSPHLCVYFSPKIRSSFYQYKGWKKWHHALRNNSFKKIAVWHFID